MTLRSLVTCSTAAVAAGAMLALSLSPAAAFTLSSPSVAASVASPQIDKVWWDRWGRWHPNYGYGWYAPHCWRGYYGGLHCN